MKKITVMVSVMATLSMSSIAQQVFNLAGGLIQPNSSTLNANVGINNDTPLLRLHIKTPATNDGIMVQQTGNTIASLNLKANSGHRWALFSTGSGNSEGPNHFGLYNYSSGGYRMFVNGNTGHVGFNTIKPLHKLHVHDGAIMISGATPGFGGPQLLFTDNLTTHPNGRWAIEYMTATSTRPSMGGLNFWTPFPGGTAGNYSLFVKDDGKIGIGVTDEFPHPNYSANPFPNGYRLYVKDGILTERLTVAVYGTMAWADYVFSPSYKLRPLAEVEAFVKQNKHLPNLPSAHELVKTGLNVGEMQAKQMEKIEELTLYIIEINKEISLLKKENTAIKTTLASSIKN